MVEKFSYMSHFLYICIRFTDQGIRHILALNPRYKNIGVALCIAIYVAFLGRIAELAALFISNNLAQ